MAINLRAGHQRVKDKPSANETVPKLGVNKDLVTFLGYSALVAMVSKTF